VQPLLSSPQAEPVQGGVAFVQDNEFDGVTEIDPPRLMPDFTLTDQTGAPLSLRELQGKPTLITFGFTHCPDICPLTLNEFRRIARNLGDDSQRVNFVFISVDGNRDTPQRLQNFFETQRVDEFVIGLTGSPDEVRRSGVDYGLNFVYSEPDATGAYTVDHSAGMFLLDSDNHWIKRYAFSTDIALIQRDIEARLNANTSP
jgi:protein SCO1/2